MRVFRKTSFISLFLVAALVTFVGRSALQGEEEPAKKRRVLPHTRSDGAFKRKGSTNKRQHVPTLRPQSESPTILHDGDGRSFYGRGGNLDPATLQKLQAQHFPHAVVFKLAPPAK